VARATLALPRILQEAVGTTRLQVEGRTVADALADAYAQLPALRHHLCDEKGRLRAHILCFVDDEKQALKTTLKDGDVISIYQAISGG
jgi:molybdopterin converting factor small subunit